MPLTKWQVIEQYGEDVIDAPLSADVMRITDGDDDYDTMAEIAGLVQTFLPTARPPKTPVVIWEHTVLSQQLVAWGFGSQLEPDYIRFPTFIVVQNAALGGTNGGGFYDGSLILRVSDRSGMTLPVSQRLDTGGLRSSSAYTASTKAETYIERDKNKLQAPLPETGWWAEEGDRLQILMLTKVVPYQTSTTTAIAADDCHFEIPVSLVEL